MLGAGCVAQQHVDLGYLETGDRDVEIEVEARQVLQLDLQDLGIPAGLLGELVVGENSRVSRLCAEIAVKQKGVPR